MQPVSYVRGGDWFAITDYDTGVTTQGWAKLEALLMLADALAGYDESLIDWEGDYDHRVVRDLDLHERRLSADEGVLVEHRGIGYGWYHGPARYDPGQVDEVLMSREAAAAIWNPCLRRFPTSTFAKQFEVTDLSDRVTRHERRWPDGDR